MSDWNLYKSPNMGLLFYKHIYKEEAINRRLQYNEALNALSIDIPNDLKPTPFDPFYKALCNYTTSTYAQIHNPLASHRFTLHTTYPGLLTGSGYMHETKAVGDFKIGYFFDHTSGQPVVPGSSVKGCLRNLFETDVDDKGKPFTGDKSVAAIRFIANELLQNNRLIDEGIKNITKQLTAITVAELGRITAGIFGDADTAGTDVFFDAVLNITKCGNNKIMGTDFITPHDDELKDPKPLQFIKVLPGIAFEFRFKLNDTGFFSAIVKEAFFKQILLTTGIGAKTNVGYGQFK